MEVLKSRQENLENLDSAALALDYSDAQHIGQTPNRILSAWRDHYQRTVASHARQDEALATALNRKRKVPALKNIFRDSQDVICAINHVWVMSPLSVSMLRPKAGTFDVVILDEASQILPWDAVTAITAARQVVVAGDDQQLQPTTFFAGGESEVSDIPVIVLTARAAETEKVRVLNGGANDYITKPFSTRELLARVQVALRNLPVGETATDICDCPLRVDRQAQEVPVLENIVRVTSLEFRLLLTLIGHRGRILAIGQLLEHEWNDPIGVGHDLVKFCVMRLRNKISVSDLDFAPIETVRGFGYRYRKATIS